MGETVICYSYSNTIGPVVEDFNGDGKSDRVDINGDGTLDRVVRIDHYFVEKGQCGGAGMPTCQNTEDQTCFVGGTTRQHWITYKAQYGIPGTRLFSGMEQITDQRISFANSHEKRFWVGDVVEVFEPASGGDKKLGRYRILGFKGLEITDINKLSRLDARQKAVPILVSTERPNDVIEVNIDFIR